MLDWRLIPILTEDSGATRFFSGRLRRPLVELMAVVRVVTEAEPVLLVCLFMSVAACF